MEQSKGFFRQINEGVHDMCYIWAKEMQNTVKDEGVLIFFILVPLLYPLLYSWAYNNEVVRNVNVVVVDMDNSALSRQFIREYDASPDVNVVFRCNDMNEARDLVQKQIAAGIVYFPADFGKQINRMEQAHVSVYCDMSLMLTYKAIYQTAQAVSSAMNSKIQVALSGNYTEREDEVTVQPLAFDEVQIFNPTGGYGSFIIPAVLMLILQQTLVLGIGLSAGTARENNRYQDLVPISRHYNGLFRIVMGKSLCYFMVYAVMGAYLTMVIPRLFGFISIFRPADLLGLMLPYILACIFFGMFVSCIVRYRENVMLLVVFASIPLLFLSGASWPQSSIPGYWQGFSWLFPSTFGVRGFIRLNSMGATLQDIAPEYRALWEQVIVYFFATCAVYRYQLIHTRRRAMERLDTIKNHAMEVKRKRTTNQGTN
ncbi:MAG: ABC transporter permease [Prevotella sp.]|nr:ABC transporter permease [Prevotella sp.]